MALAALALVDRCHPAQAWHWQRLELAPRDVLEELGGRKQGVHRSWHGTRFFCKGRLVKYYRGTL